MAFPARRKLHTAQGHCLLWPPPGSFFGSGMRKGRIFCLAIALLLFVCMVIVKRKQDDDSSSKKRIRWDLRYRCSMCGKSCNRPEHVRDHINQKLSRGLPCGGAIVLDGMSDLSVGNHYGGRQKSTPVEGPLRRPPDAPKNAGNPEPVSFLRDFVQNRPQNELSENQMDFDVDPPPDLDAPSSAPVPSPVQSSGANIKWTLKAFEGILKHLRVQLFL